MMLARIIASGINAQAPDWGIWQADGAGSRPGLIRVRRPHWPEGKAIEIPASGVDSDPGMPIPVRHHNRNRQLPYSSHKLVSARGKLANLILQLAYWLQPEGSARIACRNAQTQPQLKLSTASTVAELATLDRTADESAWTFDQAKTDILGLLQFETGAHSILAVLHAIWAEAGGLTGEGLQVREYALAGTANTPESIEIAVKRWEATNGIWPTRNHGYFFADVLAGDVIYTLAVEAGIVAYARSVSGVKITSPWVEDTARYAGRAGSIACVGRYLAECGYTGIGPDISPTGRAKFQLYVRNAELEYVPQTPVNLAALAAGDWSGDLVHRRLFPVGILQPLAEYPSAEDPQDGGWAHNLLSSRWPMLRTTTAEEWWIYLNAVTTEAVSPRWLTVAINALTAAPTVVNTFQPDWTWRMLFQDLVTTREPQLESAANASREGEGVPISGGPTEYDVVGYVVDPGDPEADPPIPPQVEEFSQGIGGVLHGTYYTGTNLQAPGVALDTDFVGQERFFAAPLPGISLPVGDSFTSSQAPAGCFNEAGQHFGICFEPQHYANDLVAVDNFSSTTPENYANVNRFYKWGDVGYSDLAGSQFYIWWLVDFGNPPVPQEPHFYITTDGPEVYGDPGGLKPPGSGNACLGEYNQVALRRYSIKQHGQYSYELRYRTQLTVFNPDKSLKFRQDISKYYLDGGAGDFPARLQSPQTLNVWQWLASGAYLWILRQDYLSLGSLLDPGDNCVDCSQEPAIEVWEIGDSEATLLHRMALHPTFDTGAEWADGSLGHPPRMLIGVDSMGRPYATIWTEWTKEGVQGHLISEILFTSGPSGGLTRSEKWVTGVNPSDHPTIVEAANAVHHNGGLYWIDGGNRVVSKSSS